MDICKHKGCKFYREWKPQKCSKYGQNGKILSEQCKSFVVSTEEYEKIPKTEAITRDRSEKQNK